MQLNIKNVRKFVREAIKCFELHLQLVNARLEGSNHTESQIRSINQWLVEVERGNLQAIITNLNQFDPVLTDPTYGLVVAGYVSQGKPVDTVLKNITSITTEYLGRSKEFLDRHPAIVQSTESYMLLFMTCTNAFAELFSEFSELTKDHKQQKTCYTPILQKGSLLVSAEAFAQCLPNAAQAPTQNDFKSSAQAIIALHEILESADKIGKMDKPLSTKSTALLGGVDYSPALHSAHAQHFPLDIDEPFTNLKQLFKTRQTPVREEVLNALKTEEDRQNEGNPFSTRNMGRLKAKL